MVTSEPPRVFLGSSSEGREVARHLQAELGRVVDVVRWDQGVFDPSGYTLDALLTVAGQVDFAILVATPDDTVTSRGEPAPVARDNIILEFGLFTGALGRDRTYLLATGDLRLPSDVLGLTRLAYRARGDGNLRAAVSDAALQVEQQVRRLGPMGRSQASAREGGAVTPVGDHGSALAKEIEQVCANAVAQGWTVKTNSDTTLRLRSPRGRTLTLPKRRPEDTRVELRRFTSELRAAGLRVNSSVRRPVGESHLRF